MPAGALRVLFGLLAIAFPFLAGCAEGATSGISENVGAVGGLVILEAPSTAIGPNLDNLPVRPYYHSFGNVLEGKTIAHAFRIENTSPDPITIEKIVPGCGCTVPTVRYTSETGEQIRGRSKPGRGESIITIPSGVIFEVEVQIDTNDVTQKNADKTSTIVITTDSDKTRYVKLEVHIFVERPFDQVPTGINFGRVPINGGGNGKVDIVQVGTYGLSITGIETLPDSVTAELRMEERQGVKLWTLEATLHPPLELGFWKADVVLATEDGLGEPASPVIVHLQAQRVPDLIAHPTRLVFTAMENEIPGELTIESLLSGHRFRIIEATLADAAHADLFDFAYDAIDPISSGASSSWRIRMSSKQPDRVTELVRGELLLRMDDEQHPEFTVRYVVHPRAAR